MVHHGPDHRFGEQGTWTSLVPFVGIALGHRQVRNLAKLLEIGVSRIARLVSRGCDSELAE